MLYLDISTEREVFPHGVALKAVVSEDTSYVRMIGEEHAIHLYQRYIHGFLTCPLSTQMHVCYAVLHMKKVEHEYLHIHVRYS